MTKNPGLRQAGAVIASLLVFVGVIAAHSDDAILYKVVINRANPVTSLARREVSAMFLRRSTRWADTTPVMAVDGPDSPAREAFSKDVHGKKAAAVRSYWLQIIFSGRGVPPPEKASDNDVISFVKANPGAIGYVTSATPTDDVKVVEVTP